MDAVKTIAEQTAPIKNYEPWVKEIELDYTLDGQFIYVGKPNYENRWIICVSLTILSFRALHKELFSVLTELEIPFRMPKDVLSHHQVNTGECGAFHTGKVLMVYPSSPSEADLIAHMLGEITEEAKGITLPDCLYLTGTVYAAFSAMDSDDPTKIEWKLPKRPPFHLAPAYPEKRKRILKWRYVPVQVIKSNTKGEILKAANLRGLSFSWCLIKRGKAHAADDEQGRDIRDRLSWQKDVLKDIAGKIPAPRVLDFFQLKVDAYLVTEFFEGEDLLDRINQRYKGRTWLTLTPAVKLELLQLYAQIVDIVIQLHHLGYVHRDITDANFIIGTDGQIKIIDFELAYSLTKQAPQPAFVLGTEGYVSPEQKLSRVPTIKEDSYSLGALLMLFLTGIMAKNFIKNNPHHVKQRLLKETKNKILVTLIHNCYCADPGQRPEPAVILQEVREQINYLNH